MQNNNSGHGDTKWPQEQRREPFIEERRELGGAVVNSPLRGTGGWKSRGFLLAEWLPGGGAPPPAR